MKIKAPFTFEQELRQKKTVWWFNVLCNDHYETIGWFDLIGRKLWIWSV